VSLPRCEDNTLISSQPRVQGRIRLVEALLALGDVRRADEVLYEAAQQDPSFKKSDVYPSLLRRVAEAMAASA
jgi:hypothetical protein